MTKPMQATFAESGFEAYRKTTRREQFLAEMDRVVPWQELCALVEPVYPKSEGPGRPTVGLKHIWRFAKVCYRGLMKNANRLFAACALANLFMVRKRLLR